MGKENKNIYYNHKLEEYNKKYSKWGGLRRYTKKEVEEFDKKNPTSIKNFLLINRSWWLIGDTYYQIPKSPVRWFKNLSVAGKVTCCVLTGAVVATGVAVPTTIAIKNNIEANRTYDYKVDYKVANKDCDIKFLSESDKQISYGIAVKESSSETITGISYVRVGSHSLKENEEYEYSLAPEDNTVVVSINKEVFSKYKGEVKIKVEFKEEPGPGPEEPYITSIEVTTPPSKVQYAVGEKLDLDGLVVTAYLSDETSRELEPDEYTTSPSTETELPEGTYNVNVYSISNPQCSASFEISVQEQEFKITGEHNVDIDTAIGETGYTYTTNVPGTKYTIDSGNELATIDQSTGELTLSKKATENGGSVTIKAEKDSNVDTFEIQIGSFDKCLFVLNEDETGLYVSGNGSKSTGPLIIPDAKYNPDGDKIPVVGFNPVLWGFHDTKISSVVIPSSFTEIIDSCFSKCDSLSSVTFKEGGTGITKIGDSAFYQCSSLSTFAIPNTVKSIGSYAFFESGIQSVIIPSDCTYIGYEAFFKCSKLTSATFADTNTWGFTDNSEPAQLIDDQFTPSDTSTSYADQLTKEETGCYSGFQWYKINEVGALSKHVPNAYLASALDYPTGLNSVTVTIDEKDCKLDNFVLDITEGSLKFEQSNFKLYIDKTAYSGSIDYDTDNKVIFNDKPSYSIGTVLRFVFFNSGHFLDQIQTTANVIEN